MTTKVDLAKTRSSLQEILQNLKEEVIESPESTRNFTIGLLKKNTWQKFSSLVEKKIFTRNIIQEKINEISRRFTKQIRKLDWKSRCSLLIQSNKNRGSHRRASSRKLRTSSKQEKLQGGIKEK